VTTVSTAGAGTFSTTGATGVVASVGTDKITGTEVSTVVGAS
jgi:hypothetical protein